MEIDTLYWSSMGRSFPFATLRASAHALRMTGPDRQGVVTLSPSLRSG